MNRDPIAGGVWAIMMLCTLIAIPSCKRDQGGAKDSSVDYYTCTMHPSVKAKDSKTKCPICSMDLVPVAKKGAGGAPAPQHDHGGGSASTSPSSGLSEFSVPVERQQQIGVTYAVAKSQALQLTIRSVGFIVPDKTRHWEFVARVEGYVQKLNVTSPGELVELNQPLLTIYSPDLLTGERELVRLLEARDRAGASSAESSERLIEAARRRLEQWNLTPKQIAELEKSRKPDEFLTLYSPFKGIVEDVAAHQGRKVMVGDHLVDVADLSVVWLWAEFFENELPLLRKGLKVAITSDSYPGEKFSGEIGLINPFLSEQMRIGKVRIDIPNAELKLLPGMYVNIELGRDMGEGLTIPVSAIMPTGSRSLVFVDKGEGKLEPRYVQLGRKFGDVYQVQQGLAEGERVVASANFLIDAESKVQGAVKSFEEAEPQADMRVAEAKGVPLPAEARGFYEPLLASYLAIQQALAADKYEAVASQAEPMRKRAEAVAMSDIKPAERADEYRAQVEAMKGASEKFKPSNLDEARAQFGLFSEPLIKLLTQFPPPLGRELNIMKCSMWEKSPGRWIQASADIANPFMGQKMLGCGEKVAALKAIP
uniref:Efflux transporter n=1 Tax=uncultured Acidobacteria bacterium A11 TaxID=1036854 RepID=F8TTJ9_9BACT|nr:efflux transporter [uncultured Acidobacteria bacterium A11]